ncbi:MAG: YvcK family protein [Candidatus Levybacteria bacterium]|nr:YvcK family protein [Candidatus Levybacteria bacterium]
MNKQNQQIVCLGGGIGTVNLIKGLRAYTKNITVVVSMADDGGSAGRLRRYYRIPPPGDLVSCIAAMSNADELLKQLLTFRFSGDRYGEDHSLPGQKFGNLMLVALASITGDFGKAVAEMERIFKTSGRILPSTTENISIWAETSVGEVVEREENIDLGRFTGTIETLHLKPENPSTSKEVISAIEHADVIIAGPGDFYTTILPVLLVPDILDAIQKSKAKKLFVVNVANKIFETPKYEINDFVSAIEKHCGSHVFDLFLVNNNTSAKIPSEFTRQYEFVLSDGIEKNGLYTIIAKDLINQSFPLYHDSQKLAKAVYETL